MIRALPSPAKAVNAGCSARQGRHQEANTLSTVTRPLKSAWVRSAPPMRDGNRNAGTGLSIKGEGTTVGSRPE